MIEKYAVFQKKPFLNKKKIYLKTIEFALVNIIFGWKNALIRNKIKAQLAWYSLAAFVMIFI